MSDRSPICCLLLASSAGLRGGGLIVSLALRVAAVAFVSSVFTVIVAEYGQTDAACRS